MKRSIIAALVLLSLSRAGFASAQDTESALRKPELLGELQPAFPEATRGLPGGIVKLRITLTSTGGVRAVEVAKSLDPALDQVAIDAVKRASWAPAYRDGSAMASRFLYPVALTPPPLPYVEAPPAASPTDATVSAEIAAPSKPSMTEVEVRPQLSEAEALRQSAEAVEVVDLERDRRRGADLGELLARARGVTIRRQGGLGSLSRIALNGLSDNQLSFFLDEVPLEFTLFQQGIGNVPTSLLGRLEIYKGVTPIRFAADALGGSINLVSSFLRPASGASASYQNASFDTHRVHAEGTYVDPKSGFYVGGFGFFDSTENNYPVDVFVVDDFGEEIPITADRFHDYYRAYGGAIEFGIQDKPWANLLSVQGFGSFLDDEIQHDFEMNNPPFGDAVRSTLTGGAKLRYAVSLGAGVETDVVVNYIRVQRDLLDLGETQFNWQGGVERPRTSRGEIGSSPNDSSLWDDAVYNRIQLRWTPVPTQTARVVTAPLFFTRDGVERAIGEIDGRNPLGARRDLVRIVTGLEWESNWIPRPGRNPDQKLDPTRDFVIQNRLSLKHYFYDVQSELFFSGEFTPVDEQLARWGISNATRVHILPWLYAKASFERTTRLPEPIELFGDNVFVEANPELAPELSDNFNVGLNLGDQTRFGTFRLEGSFFARLSDDLIVLLGRAEIQRFENVFGAESLGGEAEATWISPGQFVTINGSGTYMDFRNVSPDGSFGRNEGSRIPNVPYTTAAWRVDGRIPRVGFGNRTVLEPYYTGRFVGAFLRGWEGQGIRELADEIPNQVTHNLGVSYVYTGQLTTLTLTLDVLNFTDARVFDNFGVQRPGRTFSLKLSSEF
ncbi:MAG: TonB family protein [Myxococcota bacterium]